MRKYLLSAFVFLFSCGQENKKSPEVQPSEQPVKVGDQSIYVMDPTQSDKFLNKSEFNVLVTEQDDEGTTFKIDGFAETKFNKIKFGVVKKVPNEILTMEFLEKIREEKNYQSPIFSLEYLGVEGECDVLKISNIQDLNFITVRATLCTTTKNVPKAQADFKILGVGVTATYLLKN